MSLSSLRHRVAALHGSAALRDASIHAVAWLLLRACSPTRTHAILLRIGEHLPSVESPNEARLVARAVAGYGTCLSRALAVAARTPAADVVIGVEPRKDAPLFAHAWVEMDGVPIEPSDVAGTVIARLRGPRSLSHRP